MTVSELIEQLQQYPGHREVVMKELDVWDFVDVEQVSDAQLTSDGWVEPKVVLS